MWHVAALPTWATAFYPLTCKIPCLQSHVCTFFLCLLWMTQAARRSGLQVRLTWGIAQNVTLICDLVMRSLKGAETVVSVLMAVVVCCVQRHVLSLYRTVLRGVRQQQDPHQRNVLRLHARGEFDRCHPSSLLAFQLHERSSIR